MEKAEVLAKIQKLLALSQSTNEHEAALAAAKAQQLLDDYDLDLVALQEAQGAPSSIMETDDIVWSGRTCRWRGIIAKAVTDTSHCRSWWTKEPGDRAKRMRLLGRDVDRTAARELIMWLCEETERLSRKSMRGLGSGAKNAFCIGCASTIGQRLREAWRERQENKGEAMTALVVSSKAQHDQYFRDHGIHLYSAPRATFRNGDAYAAGKAAGRDVSLKPTRKVAGSRRLLS